jgi:lipid II:glycine glycyltransferase (peptidoglycan interpeptide bridge formation enzyme)
VLIRIEGLKLEYIKSKTQEELNLLKKDITKVEGSIEKATDIENVKYKLDRLIIFFEQEKKLTNENI